MDAELVEGRRRGLARLTKVWLAAACLLVLFYCWRLPGWPAWIVGNVLGMAWFAALWRDFHRPGSLLSMFGITVLPLATSLLRLGS